MPLSAQVAKPAGLNLVSLLVAYWRWLAMIVFLTIASSGVGLLIPHNIARTIDAFTAGRLDLRASLVELAVLAIGSTAIALGLVVVQAYASERLARDLRAQLMEKVTQQTYMSITEMTPAKLISNFGADVDSIKNFISQGVASIVASVFVMIATSAFLMWINWRLALTVLMILPLIGIIFFFVMARAEKLFGQFMAVIDSLNHVLTENVVGAPLIRLLNSGKAETARFKSVNLGARAMGLQIVAHFAAMLPFITFISNLATLIILTLGGHFIITGAMSIGEFSAFNSYLGILIFTVTVVGASSAMIGQVRASFGRIDALLNAAPPIPRGDAMALLCGGMEVRGVSLGYGAKMVFDDISFAIAPGSRTAILGPTAAGKSQLLYVMAGLLEPSSGQVCYDGRPINSFSREGFFGQVGFVFQDSKLFKLSLRENIALRGDARDEAITRALETAELQPFLSELPEGLDTVITERGSSLSGGQRQRIMLARALARNPRWLFLDDFTARLDPATEARILQNIRRNYPETSLVVITQKIRTVIDYDEIVLLMEGELIAKGTHEALLQTCPEYVQILHSQQSIEDV